MVVWLWHQIRSRDTFPLKKQNILIFPVLAEKAPLLLAKPLGKENRASVSLKKKHAQALGTAHQQHQPDTKHECPTHSMNFSPFVIATLYAFLFPLRTRKRASFHYHYEDGKCGQNSTNGCRFRVARTHGLLTRAPTRLRWSAKLGLL
jgi:hypothetical protein